MLHKCLKFLVFFTIFSSFSSISFAFCKYEYDYQSGNSYTICDNGAGGTSLNGVNLNNGTTWSQQQNRDGTYNGVDGSGNFYTGDNNTGYYNNFGTGEMCFGTGSLRTCY
tara:strand:- start:35 stop:364 length:330 start_codon:yes stop_codon:yes gene_type:complete